MSELVTGHPYLYSSESVAWALRMRHRFSEAKQQCGSPVLATYWPFEIYEMLLAQAGSNAHEYAYIPKGVYLTITGMVDAEE